MVNTIQLRIKVSHYGSLSNFYRISNPGSSDDSADALSITTSRALFTVKPRFSDPLDYLEMSQPPSSLTSTNWTYSRFSWWAQGRNRSGPWTILFQFREKRLIKEKYVVRWYRTCDAFRASELPHQTDTRSNNS